MSNNKDLAKEYPQKLRANIPSWYDSAKEHPQSPRANIQGRSEDSDDEDVGGA